MDWSSKSLIVVLFVTLTWLGGCTKIQDILHEDIYVIQGEMRFEEIEGGCWVFVDEDRGAYQLVGEKAREIEVDGAKAKLRVKERHDLLGWCPGTFVEVLELLWLRKA